MPSTIFNGLPDIFTDPSVFGEAVIYTPSGGSPVTLQAIWMASTNDAVLGEVAVDSGRTRLAVRASDVVPAEGDSATRVADNKSMTIATPILPDGNGMIVCELVAST